MSKIKYDDTDYLINREESIEYKIRCEQLIKPEHASWIGISNQLAIAHLIEKTKELEEENKHLKYLYDDCCKCLLDTIEKQKVKDLIKHETINISGFECIAVEDLEKLMEDK